MIINPAQVGSPLLSRQHIAVDTEGDLVTLTFGSSTVKMPYETALQLSQWLRVRGKEAKRRAGDQSRHWSVIASIDGLRG